MSEQITQLKQDFTEGLSQISKFWGFPKGMGAIFAVLYLSPSALSLTTEKSEGPEPARCRFGAPVFNI